MEVLYQNILICTEVGELIKDFIDCGSVIKIKKRKTFSFRIRKRNNSGI